MSCAASTDAWGLLLELLSLSSQRLITETEREAVKQIIHDYNLCVYWEWYPYVDEDDEGGGGHLQGGGRGLEHLVDVLA